MKNFTKRLLAALLSALMVMLAFPVSGIGASAESPTEFLGGNGTEEDPYLISNKNHLNNVRNHLDAHFKMVSDIEFTEADFAEGGEFYNDGEGWKPIRNFSGVFDGCNYTIKNLRINLKETKVYYAGTIISAGLFGWNTGTIKNLGMIDGSIISSYTITSASNVSVGNETGSIAGYNKGEIYNCYNTGEVVASVKVSGNTDYSTVSVSAGGIVGTNGGSVINCYNTGNIESNSFFLSTVASYGSTSESGGIVGKNRSRIDNCYNSGQVYCYQYRRGEMPDSMYAYKQQKFYAGGIAGGLWDGSITNCNNRGDVMASCMYEGTDFSSFYAGGIAGVSSSTKSIIVADCYNKGNITADTNDNWYNDDDNLYAYAGGIVGNNDESICIITRCYNTGNITAINEREWSEAGGITGSNSGTVTDCYNTGTVEVSGVKGGKVGGGIAGYNNTGYISNCYNIGSIIGETTGGIAGSSWKDEINNCYYLIDRDENLLEDGTGSNYCTDEEMQLQETYIGFDFSCIWKMGEGADYPYPYLRGHVKNIELLSCPDSMQVLEGSYPDLSEITIRVINDENKKVIMKATTQMLSDFDPNKVGTQSVHLAYGGYVATQTIDIEVIPKSVASIAVTNSPDKTTYVQGQPLNPAGGELTVYYNNNTSETMNLSEAQLSYPQDQTGIVTATAEYQGVSTHFSVTIREKQVQSIDVIEPEKVSYIEGEALDLTGGKLQITYVSDDNYTERIPLELDMISGYDPNIIGTQTLTVSYEGKQAQFVIRVTAKSLTHIEITKLPDQLIYIEGNAFDPTSGKVTLTYNNGTSEVIDLTADMVTGFDNTQVGKQSLTVTYGGFTDSFEVEIVARVNPGDADGDGVINGKDLLLMEQAVNGWDSTLIAQNADLNGDGKVNAADVLLMYQKINNGDV